MSKELESVIVLHTYIDYVKLFGVDEFLKDLKEMAPDHYAALEAAFRRQEVLSFNKKKAALLNANKG